jgi:hypothetical protein
MYDPHAKRSDAWRVPGDDPRVYAVYVDERDIVWLSDFGGNAVHAFDPKTKKFTTYPNSADRAAVRQINVLHAEQGQNEYIGIGRNSRGKRQFPPVGFSPVVVPPVSDAVIAAFDEKKEEG